MSDAREVSGAFVKRIVTLVGVCIKNSTPKRDAFVAWVRANRDLDRYWHTRSRTRAQVRAFMIRICTSFVTYSESPQCFDAEAIMGLITDDPALVDWCEARGIIEPSGNYWPLTIT